MFHSSCVGPSLCCDVQVGKRFPLAEIHPVALTRRLLLTTVAEDELVANPNPRAIACFLIPIMNAILGTIHEACIANSIAAPPPSPPKKQQIAYASFSFVGASKPVC